SGITGNATSVIQSQAAMTAVSFRFRRRYIKYRTAMNREILSRGKRSLVYHGECLTQSALAALHRGVRVSRAAGGLVILDDCFPNVLTGFRIAEFNEYLRNDASCRVLTSSGEFGRTI